MAEDVGLVRSIGIIGQGGCGKTSVADSLLFAAGAVPRLGRVDDGSSLFDTDPEEQHRRSTLSSTLHSFLWKKHDFTLVDTPGYANFLPDTLTCLRACTSAIFVVAPQAGEFRAEADQLWSECDALGLPRLAFVSRMDRDNADFAAALDDLKQSFGANPVAIHYPVGAGASLRGIVDLVARRAYLIQPDGSVKAGEVPAVLQPEVAAAREHLIELVAEADDHLADHYLEEGTLTDEELLEGLRQGTRRRTILPVACGSATSQVGFEALLDACITYLGSAADLDPAVGRDPQSHASIERRPTPDEPFSAFAFKTIVDPFAGKLTLLRIVSGTATADAHIVNASRDGKERLGHLVRLEGKKHVQVASAIPGQIVGVAKLKDTHTGDTLASDKAPIVYPGLDLPPPAISFAIRPKAKADDDKAAVGLHKLIEEDPSLEIHRDPQTHELILAGVGQMHVEVAIEKLKRKYGADVELQAPKIAYKESIRGQAEAQGRLKKQTGGHGQYGDCWLRVEPLPRGAGFEFVDQIVGGVVPRQYIPAVEKGVREAMAEGVLAGYPVADVKVTLYDGSYHDVDSSEMAFKIAASLGFKAACEKAQPILLEPIVALTITVPDEAMGDVIGDLNGRRGKVLSVSSKPGMQVIQAQAPMAEVLKYAIDLRAMTSGRGSFTLAFARYDEVPPHLAERVARRATEAKG